MSRPIAIAHRAPNDATRCRALAQAGAQMFEVDIQLRRGEVVVSHYLPLPGLLAAAPVLRDNWRLRPLAAPDPSATDSVALLPAGSDVLLDPKHHVGFDPLALVQAVGELVPRLGGPDRFVVSTHDERLLAAYRELGLRTWRSVGDRGQLAATLSAARRRGELPEAGVSVRHTLLDAESIRALHEVTGIISAWTVNRVARARHLTGMGVDAITTDRTAVLAWLASPAPHA